MPDSIKNSTDGIGNSAKQNPKHSGNCKDFHGLSETNYNKPYHNQANLSCQPYGNFRLDMFPKTK